MDEATNDEIVAWLLLNWPQYIAIAKNEIAKEKAEKACVQSAS